MSVRDGAHRCISEEQLIELMSGRCDGAQALRLLGEVELCSDCHALMLEAARALAEQTNGPNRWQFASEPTRWQPGTLIGGRYRIVRLIGGGGMGDVYEVFDTELMQTVALKTITASFSGHETSLDRLKQEVRLARRVVHPNVCRVLEFGRHRDAAGDRYFLTMEFIEGELLSKVLRREGGMNARAAVNVVRQVAEGLQAIHAENVVHRDVKSSNIILTPARAQDGFRRAVLLDFGIARQLDEQHLSLTTHGLVGTPDYMAPEQLRREAVSPATDVYALGLVLFELLCGRLPGDPALPRATWVMQRLNGVPSVPPSALNSGVPAELDRIVMWCLASKPEDRPPTMGVLLQALARVDCELGFATGWAAQGACRVLASRTRAFALVALACVAMALALAVLPSTGSTAAGAKVDKSTGVDAGSGTEMESALAPVPSSGATAASSSRVSIQHSGPEEKRPANVLTRTTSKPESSAPPSRARRCSPPYHYDEQGIRVYRKECL